MNISSEVNNVKHSTPGTTPMYEMLLFFHHWREDFKNEKMLRAFMDKAKLLLNKEYSCLQSAYNSGKMSKNYEENNDQYKELYKKKFPMNSRNIDLSDYHFAKLNPEE